MGLVRYGGGVVQMSGSIAGNTYARNRFGNYVRARTKPVNPNSHRQQRIRAIIAELTEHWYSTLTGAQRTTWDTYAAAIVMKNRLGENIHLTGFNHYIRSNVAKLDMQIARVDDGPVALTLPEKDPTMSIAASAATQQVTVTFDDTAAWCTEATGFMSLLCGRPQNITRNFFAGPYQGLRGIIGVDPGGVASPQDVSGIFTLSQGQRLWQRARISMLDGRLSEPFADYCTIGA